MRESVTRGQLRGTDWPIAGWYLSGLLAGPLGRPRSECRGRGRGLRRGFDVHVRERPCDADSLRRSQYGLDRIIAPGCAISQNLRGARGQRLDRPRFVSSKR